MANGINKSGQTAVIAVQDKSFISQFTVAASAAAGTVYPVTFYPFGFNKSSTTSFTIPSGSDYQLVNVGTSSTPSVDAQIILNLNGIDQGENFVLSQVVTGNSAKMNVTQPIILSQGDVFEVNVVTLTANGTNSVTETFVLQFLQVPS